MKQLIINEIRRMYCSRDFRISLLISIGIAVYQALYVAIYGEKLGFAIGGYFEGCGLLDCWIGAGLMIAPSYWFYLVIPLIAAYSYGGSLFDDIKSGYIKQICIRTNRKNYFISKIVTVFLSGGVCCVIPIIINFAVLSMKYPVLMPSLNLGFGPGAQMIGGALYWIHPFFYTVVYMMFDFVICGLFALASMFCCICIHNKYLAITIPFLASFLLYEIGIFIDTSAIAPIYYMVPQYGIKTIWTPIGIIVLLVIVIMAILLKGRRIDIK